MKYRFRVSEQPPSLPVPTDRRRVFRLKGYRTLRCQRSRMDESIPILDLFEIGALPEPPKRKKAATLRRLKANLGRIWSRIKIAAAALRRGLGAMDRELQKGLHTIATRLHPKPKPKLIRPLPVLSGFLCASLLVSFLSAGGVLMGLFGHYNRAYTSVVIPHFVGESVTSLLQKEYPHLNLTIEYETNPQVTEGMVIAQSPQPGVTRRIYERDGYCNIRLTVSRFAEPYLLEELVGMSERDAILLLRNRNIAATVTQVHSATAAKGSVLETVPAAGASLKEGATVLLRVSVGTPQEVCAVPNLFGMTETEAKSQLSKQGLAVGSVDYRSSSHPAGTVISQSLSAYASVEKGAAVSFSVSIGDRYWLPTVPDLYGLSLKQAEQALRQQGLVVGDIHTIEGAAPRGTVITQSPHPGAPITSATVSVDLYVTS